MSATRQDWARRYAIMCRLERMVGDMKWDAEAGRSGVLNSQGEAGFHAIVHELQVAVNALACEVLKGDEKDRT